jgi:hypothetical protein
LPGDFPELYFPDIHKAHYPTIKRITQRGFDDAMRIAGLNGTAAISKFSSWFSRVFTTFVQTIETSDFDQRLQALEIRQAEDRPTQPRPWPLSSLAT